MTTTTVTLDKPESRLVNRPPLEDFKLVPPSVEIVVAVVSRSDASIDILHQSSVIKVVE
jgi:hypothetical protein